MQWVVPSSGNVPQLGSTFWLKRAKLQASSEWGQQLHYGKFPKHSCGRHSGPSCQPAASWWLTGSRRPSALRQNNSWPTVRQPSHPHPVHLHLCSIIAMSSLATQTCKMVLRMLWKSVKECSLQREERCSTCGKSRLLQNGLSECMFTAGEIGTLYHNKGLLRVYSSRWSILQSQIWVSYLLRDCITMPEDDVNPFSGVQIASPKQALKPSLLPWRRL